MFAEPTGPDPAEWPAALVRGFHPRRWAVCLGGLAVTWVAAVLAQALYDRATPRLADWWDAPVEQVRALANNVSGRSPWVAATRLGPTLALALAGWCLAGAWVARHELIARIQSRPDPTRSPNIPGPTRLVVAKVKDLVLCCPTVLALIALVMVPVLTAALVNSLGGAGGILVAILLPVVLIADLLVLLLALGALAWPMMPVAIAIENSDTFDGLSRAYNYAFMRPIGYLFLLAISVVLAGLPLAAVLYAVSGPFAALAPATQMVILWLAAGLSASMFWSLQVLVYLHMRTAVDGTDAWEFTPEPDPTVTAETQPEGTENKAPIARKRESPSQSSGRLNMMIKSYAMVIGTWFLTAWLFRWAGGDEARWMGWGFDEDLIPPAEGLYKTASVFAAIWGVVLVILPFYRAVRPSREKAPETPTAAAASTSG